MGGGGLTEGRTPNVLRWGGGGWYADGSCHFFTSAHALQIDHWLKVALMTTSFGVLLSMVSASWSIVVLEPEPSSSNQIVDTTMALGVMLFPVDLLFVVGGLP